MIYPHLTPDKWKGMWDTKPEWWDAAAEMEVPVTVSGPVCPDHGFIHRRKYRRYHWVCYYGLDPYYKGYAQAHWQFKLVRA